jgi:hypothetical protein
MVASRVRRGKRLAFASVSAGRRQSGWRVLGELEREARVLFDQELADFAGSR